MLRATNPFKNSLNKVVENDGLVVGSGDLSQILTKSEKLKICQNLAKSKKLNHSLKLFKSKKTILNRSEILINLTMITNAGAMVYLIAKIRKTFTHLRQTFI